MEDNNEIETFVPHSVEQCEMPSPLQYEVGEVCKCYYNKIEKPVSCDKVTQSIQKCQSFGRVIAKSGDGHKAEYRVKLFDPIDDVDVRNLPGCCLRKVKVVPYTFAEANKQIGRIVRSTDGSERMMVIAVYHEGNSVCMNDISVEEMMKDYEFIDNGAPCGSIVMLKADEAFGTKR